MIVNVIIIIIIIIIIQHWSSFSQSRASQLLFLCVLFRKRHSLGYAPRAVDSRLCYVILWKQLSWVRSPVETGWKTVIQFFVQTCQCLSCLPMSIFRQEKAWQPVAWKTPITHDRRTIYPVLFLCRKRKKKKKEEEEEEGEGTRRRWRSPVSTFLGIQSRQSMNISKTTLKCKK